MRGCMSREVQAESMACGTASIPSCCQTCLRNLISFHLLKLYLSAKQVRRPAPDAPGEDGRGGAGGESVRGRVLAAAAAALVAAPRAALLRGGAPSNLEFQII